LRWFDYWLKGMDTGIMDEVPIKLFIMGSGDWKECNEWPLPETKWTPFYLHNNGLLYERQCWPDEGYDTFEDSPWGRGCLEYCSPKLVENTEVIGPIVLNLYASTSDNEVFWFISLREVDPVGHERILTRGWLRGTHREVDPSRSKPWEPFHPHTSSKALNPDEIYEFNISIVPTGNLFKAGSKIKLKISCTDDPPNNPLEMNASGHLHRQTASRVRVYHNADYPSRLLLPITKGNILETFVSGGEPYI
jgi:predicted acyl esterase